MVAIIFVAVTILMVAVGALVVAVAMLLVAVAVTRVGGRVGVGGIICGVADGVGVEAGEAGAELSASDKDSPPMTSPTEVRAISAAIPSCRKSLVISFSWTLLACRHSRWLLVKAR